MVCINCGSTDLEDPALLTPYYAQFSSSLCGVYRCRKCGFHGVPIEVENANKFRKSLNKLVKRVKSNAKKSVKRAKSRENKKGKKK